MIIFSCVSKCTIHQPDCKIITVTKAYCTVIPIPIRRVCNFYAEVRVIYNLVVFFRQYIEAFIVLQSSTLKNVMSFTESC